MDKENVTMNKPFMQGLKMIKDGIDLILSAEDYVNNIEKTQEIDFPDKINNKSVAVRVAETYNTFKPELGADKLANDILRMAENPDKVGILINWMRKKGTSGFEEFFKMTRTNQQNYIINAVTAYREDVKKILKERFSRQNDNE